MNDKPLVDEQKIFRIAEFCSKIFIECHSFCWNQVKKRLQIYADKGEGKNIEGIKAVFNQHEIFTCNIITENDETFIAIDLDKIFEENITKLSKLALDVKKEPNNKTNEIIKDKLINISVIQEK